MCKPDEMESAAATEGDPGDVIYIKIKSLTFYTFNLWSVPIVAQEYLRRRDGDLLWSAFPTYDTKTNE